MRLLLLLLLTVLGQGALAAIDVYQFDTEEQETRFRVLTEELRCPKCQNQSIADSDAGIAQDMRERVARMIREGHDDQAIVDYFVDRYGDFVSYRPPVNAQTLVLWLGPAILLLLGGGAIVILIRRASRRVEDDEQ
ncbi:cytochrome c-type biogenesis protein [Alloalcanivorax xenomutans]|jgi:cytochrome c-type biogenesis protein CcmH|uniref:Cytochrome c-type biogenesis protein n=1 Tax=Alloalcanivorax xenomutans TaxID=1094342 RepID=A0A9Q3ZH69_9GAMM|nr:cytochrome c-type biogenesis protein [Alloalcanivorax xenomutans]ARB45249.1 cytochrome C biogenesis protein [Alloalcanivorax xenomutans]MCE7510479.1 cytochrome c-type biogenesis protein CcmH [Alloalcanivorax xenomutans]WOA32913.1 cytochrome c-type biogenesis protein [Alloalcanivorax xenomutans]WOD29866.1 cytochrome c-type biogenesis protein [Alloalcanivorax xenomutans]